MVAICATVVVSAPIEPSKATTPQASTNVASAAATTRRRIRRIAAGAGGELLPWATRSERACAHPRVARREPPARTLRGSWAMTTTVIFDLDGVLVDSRAVFLSCVNYAFEKLGLPTRADAELLPYIGPPFAYGFGELLGVAARRADRRRLHRRLPRALRDRLADRDDGRARHPRGARRARRPAGSRSPPPSRWRSPSRCWRRWACASTSTVVAGPDLERPRRGQDRDARARAARARPDAAR